MRRMLATLLFLFAVLPASADAQALVVTGPAESLAHTSATLTGTVDPEGTATGYRFEYGATTAYGSQTSLEPAGAGSDPLVVRATLTGLTPATTYHFRLVAGPVAGADATFRTTAAPAPPSISSLAATEKTPASARLSARINPNRSATTFHVEWGTSSSFGNRTPEQSLPAGRNGVAVSVVLDGLPPYRRIYWRVVAVNGEGTKRSGTSTFTTLRALTGASLAVLPALGDWGGPVTITGRVTGAGVNGIPVALEQSAFPFDAGFAAVAATRTNHVGVFRFRPRTILAATRFRAVTRNAQVVATAVATARVRTRVGIGAIRRTRRSLRLAGDVSPGLPVGRATLQRRTPGGGWVRWAETALRARDANRSRYRFSVRRSSTTARYRVLVTPYDGGAHEPGTSPSVLVAKKQPKRRPR